MGDGQAYKTISLMPLSGSVTDRRKIYGFDVETMHTEIEHRGKNYLRQDFVMGSVAGDGDDIKVFWDRGRMCDYLLSRKMRGALLCATNLEFDFNILFRDRLQDFRLIHKNRLLAAIHREKDGRGRNRTWTMVDTMNYFPTSLKNLGRLVGIDKLEPPSVFRKDDGWGYHCRYPADDMEKADLVRYNVNDSVITQRFMRQFQRFCTGHNMKLKLTIASTGMDYWRRNHQPGPMFREPEDVLRLHFLGSFRGGRVEVFRRGTTHDRLFYYDYRSSYPGVMDKGTDGSGSYPDPSSWHRCRSPGTEMIEDYHGICLADVKAPYMDIPPLGVRSDNKLLFPVGTFSGWFTNHELRVCMDHGYEISPRDMVYYSREWRPFREAVRYLYRIRKRYKLEKSVYEQMVKLIMNSGLFGKWGMNWENMDELIPMERVRFDDKGRCMVDGTVIDDYSLADTAFGFDSFIVRRCMGRAPRYSFPILSSYTTMLGRMKLWNDTYKLADYLVYEDTDSATLTRPLLEQGDNLGDWELEHVSKGGVFIRPKMYMINPYFDDPVIKSKGIGRFIDSPEKFINVLETGKVGMRRFTRMKESNRMGLRCGSVMRLVKNIGCEDDKRAWERPFRLDDWQESSPLELVDGIHPRNRIKADNMMQREMERMTRRFIRSDRFDIAAVGGDITPEEFLENERWFARNI